MAERIRVVVELSEIVVEHKAVGHAHVQADGVEAGPLLACDPIHRAFLDEAHAVDLAIIHQCRVEPRYGAGVAMAVIGRHFEAAEFVRVEILAGIERERPPISAV